MNGKRKTFVLSVLITIEVVLFNYNFWTQKMFRGLRVKPIEPTLSASGRAEITYNAKGIRVLPYFGEQVKF